MCVSMNPGPTALTRMPMPASARAPCLVSIQTPAFDTEYATGPASGCFDAIDAIVTIDPPPRARMGADCGTHREVGAGEVDVDDALPVVHRDLREHARPGRQ